MSSSNSQLSYTPYQSHRRAASAVSIGGSRDIPQAPSVNQTNTPAESTSSNHQPIAQRSQTSNTVRPVVSPANSTSQYHQTSNSSNNAGSAPPPLRSLSSLKAKSSNGKSKAPDPVPSGPNDSNGKTSADKEGSTSKAVPVQSPSRRMVSSSLAVPSTSSSGTSKPLNAVAATHSESNRSNGHSKRNSMTASPLPSHNRSISNGSVPVTLPHHMSTAQRLRTVSPLDYSTPSTSSPTQTPNAPLSPVFGATTGGQQQQQFDPNGSFYDDGVGRRTAYRAGFQPKGSYRIRTDEFVAARTRRKQGGRGESSRSGNGAQDLEGGKSRSELESQRLERRLEKLFALHYDDTPLFSEEEAFSLAPAWLPGTIRKARLQAEMERRLRDEEMRIVNWEDDKSRKSCSICTTPFSFTVRKHHCRLCGRVVCASPHLSLPPGISGPPPPSTEEGKSPADDQVKCSSLVVADDQTGTKIKDVPRWDEASSKHLDANGRTRGIRICRECKDTILHRQYMLDDGSLPAYVKLYEALISLQKEIEQSLPEFQEMILGLQKHDAAAALGTADQEESHDPLLQPVQNETLSIAAIKAKNRTTLALQRDAAQARKQLLANFANYDLIAKKIRNLNDEGNASLARLKVAIWTQANTFLQANMFPLQNLPKLQSSSAANGKSVRNGSNSASVRGHKHSTSETGSTSTTKEDPSAVREQMTVLQQQLTLVRQYAASASKARKFQDASSLNQSARELEVEIDRLQKQL